MNIDAVRHLLLKRFDELEDKRSILRAPELRDLYAQIKDQPEDKRSQYGQAINKLKKELEAKLANLQSANYQLPPIDVTAPFDINSQLPELLPTENGTIHPLSREIRVINDIFGRMGFVSEEAREIDDQYNMFESLNFPKDHPARDDYDTFMTEETDKDGEPFIAPAHTSTIQNRLLKKYIDNLAGDDPIAVIVADRVFRNEDLDARHEHTFYQVEGVYVGRNIHAGMLVATLQQFLQEYYGQKLEVRVNPFYFPFTEPSFEFAVSCPFCDSKSEDSSGRDNSDCKVCSGEGWVELLGCGMIHPSVLRSADIDPKKYTGFAFGCGIDRLVMMKYAIEDVRHFHSANLNFLRQFS